MDHSLKVYFVGVYPIFSVQSHAGFLALINQVLGIIVKTLP